MSYGPLQLPRTTAVGNAVNEHVKRVDALGDAWRPTEPVPVEDPFAGKPAEVSLTSSGDPFYDNFENRPRPPQPAPRGKSPEAPTRKFTRNTEHFTQRCHQLMVEGGYADPIQVLMEIATGYQIKQSINEATGDVVMVHVPFKKDPDHKTRALAASELLSYTFPKRKSVEVSGTEGQPISFTVTADQSEIPVMPSDADIEAMVQERRALAAMAEKTIQGT
jgi:hypothetical protein